MPIYEYRCKNCDKISEFLVGAVQKKTEIQCKFCGSKELEKIFSKSFVRTNSSISGFQGGSTCCGRDERCDTPPCSDDGICRR